MSILEKDNTKEHTSNQNKTIKKRRVIRYFIDAARAIARENGLSAITIRSVAERAGYNSATLYNYFENLDQLLAFTCVDLQLDFIQRCSKIEKTDMDTLDKYILSWKVQCSLSFRDPALYAYVYFSENAERIKKSFAEYFDWFPEKAENIAEETLHAFLIKTLNEQEKYSIGLSVAKGYFTEKDGDDIGTLGWLLYRSLLLNFTLPNNQMSEEEATKIFLYYLVSYIQTKLQKEKDLSQFFLA